MPETIGTEVAEATVETSHTHIKVAKMSEKTRVLIVDDQEIVRLSYLRSLTGTHCNVALAANGEEALQAMERYPFDVVLLDLQMPGTSELEATMAWPLDLKYSRKLERIWFDDGKIGGIIRTVGQDQIRVEITQARPQGERLLPEKGINLPDTRLDLPALTTKDIEDLPHVVRHADLVGLSFAQGAGDDELSAKATDPTASLMSPSCMMASSVLMASGKASTGIRPSSPLFSLDMGSLE